MSWPVSIRRLEKKEDMTILTLVVEKSEISEHIWAAAKILEKKTCDWFLWYNLIKDEEISNTGIIVPLGKIWMSVTSLVLKDHRDGGIQIKAWLKRESCLYTASLCFVPPQHYYTTVFFSQMPVWTLMPDSQDAICASQFRVSWGYCLVDFKSPFSAFVHIYHSCCLIVHSSVYVILETVVSVAVRWWSAVTETKTHIRFSQSCNKKKKKKKSLTLCCHRCATSCLGSVSNIFILTGARLSPNAFRLEAGTAKWTVFMPQSVPHPHTQRCTGRAEPVFPGLLSFTWVYLLNRATCRMFQSSAAFSGDNRKLQSLLHSALTVNKFYVNFRATATPSGQ